METLKDGGTSVLQMNDVQWMHQCAYVSVDEEIEISREKNQFFYFLTLYHCSSVVTCFEFFFICF